MFIYREVTELRFLQSFTYCSATNEALTNAVDRKAAEPARTRRRVPVPLPPRPMAPVLLEFALAGIPARKLRKGWKDHLHREDKYICYLRTNRDALNVIRVRAGHPSPFTQHMPR